MAATVCDVAGDSSTTGEFDQATGRRLGNGGGELVENEFSGCREQVFAVGQTVGDMLAVPVGDGHVAFVGASRRGQFFYQLLAV